MKHVILIAVMATNRVIGRDNAIPWHIPEELQFFKRTTMGHPVVMGRKTFDSLKRPLPGRQNIVISRNPKFSAPGIEIANSLAGALDLAQDTGKVFILGGSKIFQDSMVLAQEIILSVLDRAVVGDIYFPAIPPDLFTVVHQERHEGGTEPFTIYYYRRTPS